MEPMETVSKSASTAKNKTEAQRHTNTLGLTSSKHHSSKAGPENLSALTVYGSLVLSKNKMKQQKGLSHLLVCTCHSACVVAAGHPSGSWGSNPVNHFTILALALFERYIYLSTCACVSVHSELRGQPMVSSLLPCGSRRLNSGKCLYP